MSPAGQRLPPLHPRIRDELVDHDDHRRREQERRHRQHRAPRHCRKEVDAREQTTRDAEHRGEREEHGAHRRAKHLRHLVRDELARLRRLPCAVDHAVDSPEHRPGRPEQGDYGDHSDGAPRRRQPLDVRPDEIRRRRAGKLVVHELVQPLLNGRLVEQETGDGDGDEGEGEQGEDGVVSDAGCHVRAVVAGKVTETCERSGRTGCAAPAAPESGWRSRSRCCGRVVRGQEAREA